MSLMVLETDGLKGFERGRKLDKIGLEAQDTSELLLQRRVGAAAEPARHAGRQGILPIDGRTAARTLAAGNQRGRDHGACARAPPSNT